METGNSSSILHAGLSVPLGSLKSKMTVGPVSGNKGIAADVSVSK